MLALTYDEFVQSWGEHHGSCSWCDGAQGPKSKKYSGQEQCIDISDLIPSQKLHVPFSAFSANNPLHVKQTATATLSSVRGGGRGRGRGNLADELLWVVAMNGRLGLLKQLLQQQGFTAASSQLPLNAHGFAQMQPINGGGVDAKNHAGQTPLFLAAQRGHYKVCELLLDHGAYVDHGDLSGRRPLHAAAGNGHVKTAMLLRKRGAVAGHEYNRETAAVLARRLGHHELAAALES